MPDPDPTDATATPVPDEPSGPIVTVFRSRHRPEAEAEYQPTAERMVTLASGLPGFIDYKSFTADDGEHVTIVTFADQATQRAWRQHPEHRAAQLAGRQRFYQQYDIQVCRVFAERHFEATPEG